MLENGAIKSCSGFDRTSVFPIDFREEERGVWFRDEHMGESCRAVASSVEQRDAFSVSPKKLCK